MLKGLEGLLDNISRELNPNKGNFEIASIPTTMTAFKKSESNKLLARLKAFIPDEQAVETVV